MDSKVAIAGLGATKFYRRGESPHAEFSLALDAIKAAAEDAGIDVRLIDGFCSFADDRNDPVRMSAALNLPRISYCNMVWGGGGGGACAAVGNAAAALAAGYCNYAVVYRSITQGKNARFGKSVDGEKVQGESAYNAPYGVMPPVHHIALRTRRFMHEYDVTDEAFCAVAMASYAHAQNNPAAVRYGKPLTREGYYASRWIAEPFRLFDCCQENDAAVAVLLTTAERARDLRHAPAYVVASAEGAGPRYRLFSHTNDEYATANCRTVAAQLWDRAGLGPEDIDVVQSYENFTGGVVMALAEHGFFHPEDTMKACTAENFSVNGGLPLNTSGGNLAECYVQGLELVAEATRQIRGDSCNQVKDAQLAAVVGAPMAAPTSSLLLGASA